MPLKRRVHDAFAVAVERWSRDGVPGNPRAWLVSTGRFKAIDAMRRRARFDASLPELTRQLDSTTITDSDTEKWDNETVEDDQLRLIFTCCHPSSRAGGPSGDDLARSLRSPQLKRSRAHF